MKIFKTQQIQLLDQYTIEQEPVSSIKLMERAADALFEAYTETFGFNRPVLIFAGPGNNGGDALALARKLLKINIDIKVILLKENKVSTNCEINKNRLLEINGEIFEEQNKQFVAPELKSNTLIIDGLFGSGLSRPLDGIYKDAIRWINSSNCEILSIDIPSGLQGENNPDIATPIVKAHQTFSLQFAKLAFLLPESGVFVGDWTILNIGLHPRAIAQTDTNYFLVSKTDVQKFLKKRSRFSHKGTYGHALIVAGSKDMAGAAILASKAAIRSGAGLVTTHSAACNRIIIQTSIPEIIFHSDVNKDVISQSIDTEKYNVLAIGPGIGTHEETERFLSSLLTKQKKSCVLDADALNIIAKNKKLISNIPENSILTPHPKEFERLFGATNNSYEQLELASSISKKHKFIIILKGAYTQIFLPNGQIYFNSTGNAGMATAGSGDVLTGIITGLLAQNYSPEEAALTGVYIHGMAGDLALNTQSMETLVASDIIDNLAKAYKILAKD